MANDKSQGYSEWNITGGSTTKDKVFLLSYAEAKMYFGLNENSNTKSCIQPTAYAIAQGVFVDGASASWWWLRSPGHEQYDAARVGADGSLYYHDVRDSSGAVRPAIWVDLDSPFFNNIPPFCGASPHPGSRRVFVTSGHKNPQPPCTPLQSVHLCSIIKVECFPFTCAISNMRNEIEEELLL